MGGESRPEGPRPVPTQITGLNTHSLNLSTLKTWSIWSWILQYLSPLMMWIQRKKWFSKLQRCTAGPFQSSVMGTCTPSGPSCSSRIWCRSRSQSDNSCRQYVVHLSGYLYLYLYIYIHTHTYIYIYRCRNIYIHMHIYVHIYAYIHDIMH